MKVSSLERIREADNNVGLEAGSHHAVLVPGCWCVNTCGHLRRTLEEPVVGLHHT